MIIRNFDELAQDKRRRKTLNILESGFSNASPEIALKKFLRSNSIVLPKQRIDLKHYTSVYVVAFGKAADLMTLHANRTLDIKSGIVIIPKGVKSVIKSKKFKVFYASHPIPDQSSVLAAKYIMKFLSNRRKTEFVLFLVSGGASSLLCLPDNISLYDKKRVNNLLLKSGATIHEVNCVRKHLSKIKGGRMIEKLSCEAISLVMSDVPKNDLTAIASGMTYCDKTTFSDALAIVKKYDLLQKIPKNVLKHLIDGRDGKISETPKKPTITNHIIATNDDCLASMKNKAMSLGYVPKTLHIYGDIKLATKKLLKAIHDNPNNCIIFGGETTVNVIGKGKGGRNQELVLRILKNIQNDNKKIVIASAGTDGIDGNTLAAGAIAKNFKVNLQEIKSFLKNNDSNSFFKKYGGLIYTGFTHTNLMDIGVALT